MITVIGLGFNNGSITKRGMDAICKADTVIMRTLKTSPSKALGNLCNGSCDFLYDRAQNFDELNSMIASELIRLNESYPSLVYCVDGDGYKDSSVEELVKRTEVNIIPGPFDLALRPSTSCVYMSAYDIGQVYPDPKLPVCIYNIDDGNIASEVKLFLLRFYSPETQVLLATGASSVTISLEDLDRQRKYTADTAVYAEGGNNSSFADLLRIMKMLTAPDGCPWDKAQTHDSIRINLLEEAYETVEAITDKDLDNMIEELGDVLLQVVFHCDIALRSGEFTLEDVIKGLNDKLVGRHTHIFGTDKAEGADGALNVWERNKMKEKHQEKFSDAVNDIPKCFPALLRAQKAVKRVEKGGWGRKDLAEIRSELDSALDDLFASFGQGNSDGVVSAMGKALMRAAQLGQRTGINCEQALLDAVTEIQKDYTAFEAAVLRDGKDVNALTDEEWKEYYDKAKSGDDR